MIPVHGPAPLVLATEFAFYVAVGLPFAWAAALPFKGRVALGARSSAPLAGLVATGWVASVFARLGWSSSMAGPAALGLAIAGVLALALGRWLPSARSAGGALLAVTVIAGIAIALHTSDLARTGLDAYYPRTNSDSFAYAGAIDQLRTAGTPGPVITYPAGFQPLFPDAFELRGPDIALMSAEAEFFDLGTSQAFFSFMRVTLPLAAVGVFSLLLVLPLGYRAAVAGTMALVVGNFMLPQVLQQFPGTAAGLSMLLLALVALSLYAESGFRWQYAAWAGVVAGVYADASPEAHAYLLLALLVVLVIALVLRRRWRHVTRDSAVFLVASAAGAAPFIADMYPTVWEQWQRARCFQPSPPGVCLNHPGDWIAEPGYLLQAAGIVPGYAGGGLRAAGWSGAIVAAVVAAATLAGTLAFLWLAWRRRPSAPGAAVQLLVIATVSGGGIAAAVLFFVAGRGYNMLKTWDYHAFVPALSVGILAELGWQALQGKPARVRAGVLGLAALGVAAWMGVVLPKKFAQLDLYADNVDSGVPLAVYRLPASAAGAVRPELTGFALNLFLYENRFATTPIVIAPGETPRFVPAPGAVADVVSVFRLVARGADPTLPSPVPARDGQPADAAAYLAPVVSEGDAGYVALQGAGGWAAAGPEAPPGVRYWIGDATAAFRLVPSSRFPPTVLRLDLVPGPGVTPGAVVDVFLDGRPLGTVDPRQGLVSLPLPGPPPAEGWTGTLSVAAAGDTAVGVRALYPGPYLPGGAFHPDWSDPTLPVALTPGAQFTVEVTLANAGTATWPAPAAGEPTSSVYADYHWLSSDLELLPDVGLPTALPRDLAPGDAVRLRMGARAPAIAGDYVLELTLIEPGHTWFEAAGAPTLRLPVAVR